MGYAFNAELSVLDAYFHSIEQISTLISDMSSLPAEATSEEEALIDRFYSDWVIEALELDTDRRVELAEATSLDLDGRPVTYGREPVPLYLLPIYFKPKKSNPRALTLRGDRAWLLVPGIDRAASFDAANNTVYLHGTSDDIQRLRGVARNMIDSINAAIDEHYRELKPTILGMIRGRRDQLHQRESAFEEAAQALGVFVRRRQNPIEPVDVRVHKSVKVLRDLQCPQQDSRPGESQVTPESVREIVGLIDRAGRGFEVTPRTYGKLGEEDLRDIILGYLNAVFAVDVATGETFSKNGKTDIRLQVRSGAVLIGECKNWGGPRLYAATIDQLMGYVTWRQTVAIMVCFSGNKDMSKVIEQAEQAIRSHATHRGAPAKHGDSYLTSAHQHPDDDRKSLELHHLFFNVRGKAEK